MLAPAYAPTGANHHLPERSRDVALHALVARAADGDNVAWAIIVRRFSRRLASLARSYRLAPEDVDEVVQRTFISLYRHIDSLRDPAALPGWLETTARHEALRLLSRRRQEPALDEEFAGGFVAPYVSDGRPSDWYRGELAQAIDRLPTHQRLLLRLLNSTDEPSY